ncbi:hypothetical protein D1007_05168 [Hordeum vulgare]|nr:hypothetical protein D1007_05168 [Hordeum vulgare]
MMGSGNDNVEDAKRDEANADHEMVVSGLKEKDKMGHAGGTAIEGHMVGLLKRLNLTSKKASAVVLEDENKEDLVSVKWALIGKERKIRKEDYDTMLIDSVSKRRKNKYFSMSRSGHSSESSVKSSYHEDKNGDSLTPPKTNEGERKTERMEVQEDVISPIKSKDLNYKQKNTMEVGRVSIELSPTQQSDAKITGQKRKQVKMYRPKGQVQA